MSMCRLPCVIMCGPACTTFVCCCTSSHPNPNNLSSLSDYLQLRALGSGAPLHDMQRAQELEFIVMKGDHWYEAHIPPGLRGTVWQRNGAACVHRSPPAATTGPEVKRRRVIVSLDLATGDDDREWYDADMKRSWRSGMTQRKSRLVA